MEDYSTLIRLGEDNVLAGVFDGHGGPEVASYVSQVIGKELLN